MTKHRSIAPLLIVFSVFLLLVAIVNPFREMMTQDDGWAYARSVQHLVDTGEYRLDQWAAANMPVQIWLAAGLSWIFGYSLSLLRLTTLGLLLVASLSFYGLLREFDLERKNAAAFSCVLMCCPLVLWLGFTFMTDIQFLGWMLTASWLYVKGLRSGKPVMLLAGGLAACAAVGTRQFGVALPVGLLIAALITRADARTRLASVFAGALPPLAVFAWQLWFVRLHPTITQAVRLEEQANFMSQSFGWWVQQLIWRFGVLIEYSGLLLCALLPILVFERLRDTGAVGNGKRRAAVYVVWCVLLLGGNVLSFWYMAGTWKQKLSSALLPSTPWVLGHVLPSGLRFQIVVTAVAVISATLLFDLIVRDRFARRFSFGCSPVNAYLLGVVTAFAALHLSYVQLNDTYIIIFLPFILLKVALILQHRGMGAHAARMVLVPSLMIGLAVAVWLRGDYNGQVAIWRSSETLRAGGVDPLKIRGSLHFVEYHSAFDRWIKTLGPTVKTSALTGSYALHRSFMAWVAGEQENAPYVIYTSHSAPQVRGYRVVDETPFRDALMRRRTAYVLQRTSPD